MEITEVSYKKTSNLGDYNSEQIGMVAVVGSKEKPEKVLAQLKALVEGSSSSTSEETEDETPEADEVEATRSTKKKGGKKAAEEEIEEEVVEEEEEQPEEEEAVEEEEATEEEEKPKAAKGKTFKKKPQVYQRSNETHKEIFSGVMKKAAPDWKKTPESKDKAKQVSMTLEGENFLDEEGSVLPEFQAEVKKLMTAKKKK